MNNPIGSIWRKWDLHFHTPSSYDYENNSVNNQDIIDCLLRHEVSVVAITDHHYIDVGRIKDLRNLSKGHLSILPGIELRSELGDKPIHYIALFSETLNIDHLWDTIKGAFGLTKTSIQDKGGDDKVYVKIEKAFKVISDLNGLISIHAGAKSNSIENIENKEQFQQRIKFDITNEYVNFLEIGQIKDISRYIDIVFPATGLDRPIIIGSDNHNIKDYENSLPCWLKADPTFIGLKQVINEPRDRVFIGDRPEIFNNIEDNKPRYIKSLNFSKRSGSTLDEKWFSDISLEFNSGLIAIIGNKGTGKSALADVIGLLGNCPHENSFSFLQPSQFRHPRENKAQHFDATLTWLSGKSIRRNLNEKYDPSSIESIRYIPQFHMDAICDELKGGQEGKFNEELKHVIFSRVPIKERLSKESLDSLISFKTAEIQERIQSILQELRKSNEDVANLEEQSTTIYKESLHSEMQAIKDDIEAHKSNQLKEIKRPDSDPKKQKEIEQITKKIDELLEEVKEIDEHIQSKSSELKKVVYILEVITKLRRKLDNFRKQFDTMISDIAEDCKELNISTENLLKLKIDESCLNAIEKESKSKRTGLESILDEKNEGSLIKNKKRINNSIQSLREKLDLPNKEYQAYIEKKSIWENKLKSLLGDNATPGTLHYFESRLNVQKKVPDKLDFACKKQLYYAKQIFLEKRKQLSIYEALYGPVQEFIDTHSLARDRYGLEFSVALVPNNFLDRFLSYINQGRIGSFYGDSEGRDLLKKLITSADFKTEEGILTFINIIIDYLHFDYRDDEKNPVLVANQLRKDYKPADLYKYLYSLEFLEPRYILKWEGKQLEQLSPGERGTLLLIFYLLIDNSNIPLVIDQPEGNLDNQTVFQLLVDCVKESKKKRQIIIVTHNPNLAVVCDAEQVIHARLNKEDKHKLTYSSGALERPEICMGIIDVLEGTKPAIDNRIAKYKIIFNGS